MNCFFAPSAFDFVAIFGNFLTKWYLYLILFVFVALLILLSVFIKNPEKPNIKGTKLITLTALFVALSFIGNLLSFGPDGWKFSITPFISFIAGFYFPPLNAFSIGFLGDLIAGIVAPQGAYNPVIGLSSGLFALIPSVIFNFKKGNLYLKTCISYFISFIICSVIINTIATYYMYFGFYSKNYETVGAYLVVRILPTFVSILVINLGLSLILLKPMQKIQKYIIT